MGQVVDRRRIRQDREGMTMSQPAFARRIFVGSDIYRRPAYGNNHPLAIPRVETVMDLCEVLGWLPPGAYHESPVASAEQLAWFHDPDYIEALRGADAAGKASAEMRDKYGLGTIENAGKLDNSFLAVPTLDESAETLSGCPDNVPDHTPESCISFIFEATHKGPRERGRCGFRS